MAEGFSYGVHLARCSALYCQCRNVQNQIKEDLSEKGVKVASGYDVYPTFGLTSDSFLEFTQKSEITVIPLCKTPENFIECSKDLQKRFSIVLSQNIISIPEAFRDFHITPMYVNNVRDTSDYKKLIDDINSRVTVREVAAAHSKVEEPRIDDPHAVEITAPPVTDIVSSSTNPSHSPVKDGAFAASEKVKFQQATSSDDSSVYSGQVSSSGGTSSTCGSSNNAVTDDGTDSTITEDNDTLPGNIDDRLVHLPSLKVPPSGDDVGPLARYKCTRLSDQKKIQFEQLVGSRAFPQEFNRAKSQEDKRDMIMYAVQTFPVDKLNRPLSQSVQLIMCTNETVRTHGMKYVERQLFQWHAVGGEELGCVENDLFSCLLFNEEIEPDDLVRLVALYSLCVVLLCHQKKQGKLIRKRLESLDKSKTGLSTLPKESRRGLTQILKSINLQNSENTTVARILKFHESLKQFSREQNKRSVTQIESLLKGLSDGTFLGGVMDRNKNPAKQVLRLIVLRGLIVSIEYYTRPGEFEKPIRFLGACVASVKSPWSHLFIRELQTLLFHKNPIVSSAIKELLRNDQNNDRWNKALKTQINDTFASVALQFKDNHSTREGRCPCSSTWREDDASVGGSVALQIGSFVSVVYNQVRPDHLGQHSKTEESRYCGYYETEARILGNMTPHRCIVQLLALNNTGDVFAYIVEKPTCQTLDKYLRHRRDNGKWVSTRILNSIALEVIKAVNYCQSKGILHRDLNASNFYYSEGGIVKLSNFGVAHEYDVGDDKTSVSVLTEWETSHVSTLWCSPETLRERKTSTASEVWMLGQTLLEIYMHGLWPYSFRIEQKERLEDVATLIANDGIKPREYPGCVPGKAYEQIMSCLNREDDERPTIHDLKEAFVNICETDKDEGSVWQFDFGVRKVVCPKLCQYQLDKKSQPDKGIPQGLTEEVSSPLQKLRPESFSERTDEPEFREKRGKLVIVERPIYKHTEEEIKCISDGVPHLVQISAEDTGFFNELVTEWRVPGAQTLVDYLYGNVLSKDIVSRLLRVLRDVLACLGNLHHRDIIHRDICARHVLVNPQNGGGCLYRLARMRRLPQRDIRSMSHQLLEERPEIQDRFRNRLCWFPPEVLRGRTYSRGSDVYMFGIMVWEAFNIISSAGSKSNDGTPYGNTDNNEKLAELIDRHQVLEKPKSCPSWLFEVLKACWNPQRCERPSVDVLINCIKKSRAPPKPGKTQIDVRTRNLRKAVSQGQIIYRRNWVSAREAQRPKTDRKGTTKKVTIYDTGEDLKGSLRIGTGTLSSHAASRMSRSIHSIPDSALAHRQFTDSELSDLAEGDQFESFRDSRENTEVKTVHLSMGSEPRDSFSTGSRQSDSEISHLPAAEENQHLRDSRQGTEVKTAYQSMGSRPGYSLPSGPQMRNNEISYPLAEDQFERLRHSRQNTTMKTAYRARRSEPKHVYHSTKSEPRYAKVGEEYFVTDDSIALYSVEPGVNDKLFDGNHKQFHSSKLSKLQNPLYGNAMYDSLLPQSDQANELTAHLDGTREKRFHELSKNTNLTEKNLSDQPSYEAITGNLTCEAPPRLHGKCMPSGQRRVVQVERKCNSLRPTNSKSTQRTSVEGPRYTQPPSNATDNSAEQHQLSDVKPEPSDYHHTCTCSTMGVYSEHCVDERCDEVTSSRHSGKSVGTELPLFYLDQDEIVNEVSSVESDADSTTYENETDGEYYSRVGPYAHLGEEEKSDSATYANVSDTEIYTELNM